MAGIQFDFYVAAVVYYCNVDMKMGWLTHTNHLSFKALIRSIGIGLLLAGEAGCTDGENSGFLYWH
jgi:hypothetical protein